MLPTSQVVRSFLLSVGLLGLTINAQRTDCGDRTCYFGQYCNPATIQCEGIPCTLDGYTGSPGHCSCLTGYVNNGIQYVNGQPTGCTAISCAETGYTGPAGCKIIPHNSRYACSATNVCCRNFPFSLHVCRRLLR